MRATRSSLLALVLVVGTVESLPHEYPICAPVMAPSRWTSSVRPAQVKLSLQTLGNSPSGYIIYNYEDEPLIGVPVAGRTGRAYFCTETNYGIGDCSSTNAGRLMTSSQGAPQYPITSSWGTFLKSQDIVHPVNTTGVYCVRLITAGLSSLSTQFLNPYGELPAEFYPLLKLSGALLLGYGLLLLLWCWLSIRNYRHLMSLQNHIGAVLLLSTLEMGISYLFYHSVNVTGRTSYLLVLLVALASAARGTAALFFLLLASLGYGVVIASLEADKKRSVYILTGAHLFFSTASTVASVSNPQAGALSTLLLTVPLTITYTLFCHWILAGLASTRENLAIRKQRGKLAMYKQMTRVLYALFALAAIFMIMAVLVVLEHKDGAPDGNVAWRAANWKWLWFLSSGWPMILTFLGTVTIAWIFRPQTYNRTYGVSELNEYPLDEDDLDGRATVALDALRRGKTGGDMEVNRGDSGRDRWASESLDAFAQDPSEDEGNLRPRELS